MKIIFSGEFFTLNEYINVERTSKYAAASTKKIETARAVEEAEGQIYEDIPSRAIFTFTWYRPNRRSDPDNIAFAKKFLLDALVSMGAIKNDGWNQVAGLRDDFVIDKENPRTELEIVAV